MATTHPIGFLAFISLAAVAVVTASYFASAPKAPPTDAGPVAAQAAQPAPVGVAAIATPIASPRPQSSAIEAAATLQPASRPEPRQRVLNTPTLVWELEAMRPPREMTEAPAEQEVESAGPAPAFVGADTVLYAKDNARLRAAPHTTADVMTRLAVNEPLHAVARSADGAWWRVSISGGRTGYVYKTAVAENRIATAKPAAAKAAPVEMAEIPQPATRRRDGLLGYVDDTMDWFVDTAGQGRTPTVVRPEH